MINCNFLNLGQIYPKDQGSCGYCSEETHNNKKQQRGWFSSGFHCQKMSVGAYKELMDLGWRRCGTYYYKVDYDKCCCRPYTIRLNVEQFVMRRSHGKIYRRFQNLIKTCMDDKPIAMEIKQKQQIDQDSQQQMQQQQCIERDNLVVVQQVVNGMYQKMIGLFGVGDGMQGKVRINYNVQKRSYQSNLLCLLVNSNKVGLGEQQIDGVQGLLQNQQFQQLVQDVQQSLDIHKAQLQLTQQANIIIKFQNQQHLKTQNQNNHHQQQQQKNKDKDKGKDKEKDKDKEKEKKKKKEKEKEDEDYISKHISMKLVKAQFEEESFEMYKEYCKVVHKKEEKSKNSYIRFLCEQALVYEEKEKEGKKLELGCYHMKYYLKNKLIAVGVVDIFEECLSSVYYFYDPEYKKYSIGIVGSLMEIDYIKKMQKQFEQFKYYYLGFYIQSSKKMVYKGDYGPCYLLCSQSYQWIELESVRKLIDEDLESAKLSDLEAPKAMKFGEGESRDYVDRIRFMIGGRQIKVREFNQSAVEYIYQIMSNLVEQMGKEAIKQFKFGV